MLRKKNAPGAVGTDAGDKVAGSVGVRESQREVHWSDPEVLLVCVLVAFDKTAGIILKAGWRAPDHEAEHREAKRRDQRADLQAGHLGRSVVIGRSRPREAEKALAHADQGAKVHQRYVTVSGDCHAASGRSARISLSAALSFDTASTVAPFLPRFQREGVVGATPAFSQISDMGTRWVRARSKRASMGLVSCMIRHAIGRTA